jgi:hypothetical protein
MKLPFAGALTALALSLSVTGAVAIDDSEGVQRKPPPSVGNKDAETTQNPDEARQKPYEPATGLDHGSVGGTPNKSAPGDPTARTGESQRPDTAHSDGDEH